MFVILRVKFLHTPQYASPVSRLEWIAFSIVFSEVIIILQLDSLKTNINNLELSVSCIQDIILKYDFLRFILSGKKFFYLKFDQHFYGVSLKVVIKSGDLIMFTTHVF